MGADTYRQMSGFAAGDVPNGQEEFREEEQESMDELTQASKVVFSSTLEEPLAWANSTLVRGDAVDEVRAMKDSGSGLLSTIGSLSLCRSLLKAGLVARSGAHVKGPLRHLVMVMAGRPQYLGELDGEGMGELRRRLGSRPGDASG